jgi:Family of unknown function (DUF5681)
MANDDLPEGEVLNDQRVGYRKPPRHTQFKPGQSGNPKGRPKKKTTFDDKILEYAEKPATISNGGKVERGRMKDRIASTVVAKAAEGDHRSVKIVRDVLKGAEHDPGDNLPELARIFRRIYAQHEATDFRCSPRTGDDDTSKE